MATVTVTLGNGRRINAVDARPKKARARAEQAAQARDAQLQAIALEHLDLETLATRRSDSLDFSDQAVWSIKAALEAAFEAGRRSA